MNKLLIIAGPTGVGKSDLAVQLAKKLHGEIISSDSMQIYRGMDIGSAKITREEMEGVPHHLLDIIDPEESFSAAQYQELALATIKEIQSRGKLPIMTGGTGLYINAVIYPLEFTAADRSDAIRAKFEAYEASHGREALHDLLKAQDPISAQRIHPNNVKRVIRALEVQEMTGQPFSSYGQEKQLRDDLSIFYYWISRDRQKLYDRINQRVDLMMEAGLLNEVKALRNRGLDRSAQSMQGIGYKEILDYLEGDISLEEAVNQIKQGSRNYAKRQMTWFRNEKNCTELSREKMTDDEIMFKIEGELQNI